MNEIFHRIAHRISEIMGSSVTFMLALVLVLVWGLLGPPFEYSDSWQLAINTTTTILTFLMVFLIQNTQNRDSKALHLKLDELIRGSRGARDTMVDAEDLSEEEMDKYQKEFVKLQRKAIQAVRNKNK